MKTHHRRQDVWSSQFFTCTMDLDKSGIKDQQGIVWIVSGNRRLYAFGLSGTILGDVLEMTRARYKQIPVGNVKVYRGQKGSAIECRNLITFDIIYLDWTRFYLAKCYFFSESLFYMVDLGCVPMWMSLERRPFFIEHWMDPRNCRVSFHRFLMDFEKPWDMSEVKAPLTFFRL